MERILFLMFCCISFVAQGQVVSDTASVKAADLKNKNKPEIPMRIPNTVRSMNLPVTQGYRMYDLQLMQPFPSRLNFEPEKLHLNLNFEPKEKIWWQKLLYGAAVIAGSLNNNIVGEDKMMRIRMDNAVNSRSGIPESAKSAHGVVTVKYE